MKTNPAIRPILALVALLFTAGTAQAQGTAFTYQGRLNDNGAPASGIYDLRFAIYDALAAGNVAGGPLTNASVAVSNGLFAVTLDLGAGVFNGSARWLEIGARTGGGPSDFTTLAPRQPLTPAPHAIFANTASNLSGTLPASQLSGTVPPGQLAGAYTGAVAFNNPANSFSGDGASLAGLNASNLAAGTVADARLSANVALLNGSQTFSGTKTFSPAAGAPFAVGSSTKVNNLNTDLVDGLDSSAFAPAAHHHDWLYWKIGGNTGTTPGTHFLGTTDAPLEIRAEGSRALRLERSVRTVGTFPNLSVHGSVNVIGGASVNFVESDVLGATVAGGGRSPGLNSSGLTNRISADYGTIGGGVANVIQANAVYATIPGGRENEAAGQYSLAAGRQAKANHTGAFVWADSTSADFASSGTNQFLVRASGGVGIGTTAPDYQLTVSDVSHQIAVVDADNANKTWTLSSIQNNSGIGLFENGSTARFVIEAGGAVGIGETNPAAQLHIRLASSLSNPHLHLFESGANGFARMRLTSTGKPYWDIAAGGANNVINFYTSGGNGDVMTLTTNGNLTIDGTLTQGSDRQRKTDIAPVEPLAVLEKVAALPLATWRYTSDSSERKHLGPMAQDFHAAFGLNGADDKHIATVDADGVALAAIQGLNQKLDAKLQQKETEIAELKQRLEKLEQLFTIRKGGGK